MRSLVAYSFTHWILVVLIAFSVLSSPPVQVATPLDADWTWLNENFHNVLDHMFALEKGNDVLVSYRSYETLKVCDPENSFSISERCREVKGSHSAHIHVPYGEPSGRHLLASHKGFLAKST